MLLAYTYIKKEFTMKKLSFILCAIILLLISTSCAVQNAQDNSQSDISALESQIADLRENQSAADSESAKILASLLAELSALKGDTESTESDTTESTEDTKKPVEIFSYTVSENTATITKYNGADQNVVIPASIDGYAVRAIADKAFSGTNIKSVIISNGVKELGWFVFENCPKLHSVTVPQSVESIGYDAFGGTGASVTIYCHNGSFAASYAKSYGLSYALI